MRISTKKIENLKKSKDGTLVVQMNLITVFIKEETNVLLSIPNYEIRPIATASLNQKMKN